MKSTECGSILAGVCACLAAFSAVAADSEWDTKSGGDLDDIANWKTPPSGGNLYVREPQSAPFTVSSPSATLNGNLRYNMSAHTNVFGAGYSLSLGSKALHVEGDATLFQKSGSLSASAKSYLSDVSRIVVDGSTASLALGDFQVRYQSRSNFTSGLVVTNGGAFSCGAYAISSKFSHLTVVDGAQSRLTASGALTMGGDYAEDPAANRRTVSVQNQATASFAGAGIGVRTGNNTVRVDSGATVKFSGDVSLANSAAKIVTTNNVISVSGGATAEFLSKLNLGEQAGSFDNRVEVSGGGQVTAKSAVVGASSQSHHNSIAVSGAGSVFRSGTGTASGFEIGVSGAGSNTVVVTDGALLGSVNKVLVGGSGVGNTLTFTHSATGLVKNVEANAGGTLRVADSLLTVTNDLAVTDGGATELTNATMSAANLTVAAGGRADVRDSSVALVETLTGGGVASFTDSALTCAEASATQRDFGGTGMIVALTNSTLTANGRLNFFGSNFTLRLVDSTLTALSSSWLMLGSGSGEESSEPKKHRTFVFGGTKPKLVTSGSGIYFRGADTLRFEIPKDGFPTDRAVIDVGSGKFGTDGVKTTAALEIVVDVDPACPRNGGGTFTLMRGDDVGKFADRVTVTPRCADFTKVVTATVDGKAAIQAVVKPQRGLVIFVR